MIEEYSRDRPMDHPRRIKQTIRLIGKLDGNVLDLGGRNLLREKLEEHFDLAIYGTLGDLDSFFSFLPIIYDHIIMSHILEHIFCPMNVFNRLNDYITANTVIHVFLPHRRYTFLDLTVKESHYNEITPYAFRKFCERIGYEILYHKVHKHHVQIWRRFIGLRALLRMLFDWNIYYRIQKGKPFKGDVK